MIHFEICKDVRGRYFAYSSQAGQSTNGTYSTPGEARNAAHQLWGSAAVDKAPGAHPSSASTKQAPAPKAAKAPRVITTAQALEINRRAREQLGKATVAQERAANRVAAIEGLGPQVLRNGRATPMQAQTVDRKAQREMLDAKMNLTETVGSQNIGNVQILGGRKVRT